MHSLRARHENVTTKNLVFYIEQDDFLTDDDTVQKILNAVDTRLPSCIAKAVLKIPTLKKQVSYKLFQEIDGDCEAVQKRMAHCCEKKPILT